MKGSLKKRITFFISLSFIIATIGFYRVRLPFLKFMELKTYDLRFVYRGILKPGNEIALIVIDEKSLDEIGRWEWPRSMITELIHKLKKYNVKVIGFDIVFPEPDQHSQLKTIISIRDEAEKYEIVSQEFYDTLSKKTARADTDGNLARAIKEAGNVMIGYFFHTEEEGLKDISRNDAQFEEHTSKFAYPLYTLPPRTKTAADFPMTEAKSLELNLPSFTSASKLSGYFNIDPDSDGVMRAIDLAIRFKDNFLIPLSLQMLRSYLNYPEIELKFHEDGIEKVRLGNIDIPCNKKGKMLINYRGEEKTFKHYSFTDIIHDRIPAHKFTDKIVLVGATAKGIYDIRNTPLDKTFPGLEVHANVIDTILRGDFLHRSIWTKLVDILIIIAMGLFTGLMLPRFKAIPGALFTSILFFFYIFVACFVFTHYRLLVSIIYPVMVHLLTYIGITAYHYMAEEKEKRRIRTTFQHYLAPSVVEQILEDPEKLQLGGEEKELTILFCDIRNFTTLSERLSPSQIEQLLNEYFTAMTTVVFKHDGTLDKYMGDNIMAFFGAPLDQPDHHLRACHTAIGMIEELKMLQEKWKSRGLPPLDSGIGINSGPMVVGNMGSASLFDYTVIGDNVNLGSRLEGLNKQYGTNIIVSEYTYRHVKDEFKLREVDLVRVKGKEKAVKIYELLRKEGIPFKWEEPFLTHYEKGLKRYRNGEWMKAIEEFSIALRAFPNDSITRLYITRCKEFQETPPPDDWGGIYRFKEK
jgi:adenylate cyclase